MIGSRTLVLLDLVRDVLEHMDIAALLTTEQDGLCKVIERLVALSAKSRSDYPQSIDVKAFQSSLAKSLDVALQKITVESFINVTKDLLSRKKPAVSH